MRMLLMRYFRQALICGLLVVATTTAVFAALTAEHRKQITEIKKELGKFQTLQKSEPAAAEKLLDDSESKLKEIVRAAEIQETDKSVAGLFKTITQRRAALEKKAKPAGGGTGLSFEKEIAPILRARCINCHDGANARGRLSMETFAGIRQGGASGPLLVAKNPLRSNLIARISTADAQRRMPKDDTPLADDEIKKIAAWITAGATFDGTDETAAIGSAADQVGTNTGPTKKAERKPVKIEMATGQESVSFKRDLAPMLVNLCLRCHSGPNPRSGFSMQTFEDLMSTGDNGPVVVPGDKDASRLWQLTVLQKPLKMPPGQARITRSQAANIQKWIDEGARYDGSNPKETLRSLVPTPEQLRQQELAKMSPEELQAVREERTAALWKAAFPMETREQIETPEFIVCGNVDKDVLKKTGELAEAQLESIRKSFREKADNKKAWRGKLSIFVVKDIDGYIEFALSNENRELERTATGHVRVSANQDDAYIVFPMTAVTAAQPGDETSASDKKSTSDKDADQPDGQMKSLLVQLLASAYLQRGTARIPDWITRGTGMYLASQGRQRDLFFRSLPAVAATAVRGLDKPVDLFGDGAFSIDEQAAVSFSLVQFLISSGGGENKFFQFVQAVQNGADPIPTLANSYGDTAENIAWKFGQSLATAKPIKKR